MNKKKKETREVIKKYLLFDPISGCGNSQRKDTNNVKMNKCSYKFKKKKKKKTSEYIIRDI